MGKEYTMEEVGRHNKPDDIWIVIDGKIYDVTEFIKEHPGGKEPLLNFAGKDASVNFHNVGHSDEAKSLMKKFYVGDVATTDENEEDDFLVDDSNSDVNSKFVTDIVTETESDDEKSHL